MILRAGYGWFSPRDGDDPSSGSLKKLLKQFSPRDGDDPMAGVGQWVKEKFSPRDGDDPLRHSSSL